MKLANEALRAALAQPVATVVTALIVAGVCAAILSTTGQTVQAERQVLSRIDAAGTRSIVISDATGGAGITASAVERISRISGVEWVIGLGPARDVRAAANPGGQRVAIRTIHGDLPGEIRTVGLAFSPGRALAGPEAQKMLGLEAPFGGVVGDPDEYAVVGSFHAEDPLGFLNRSLLTRPTTDDVVVRSIHIVAETPAQVAAVAEAALTLLAPEDRGSLAIETSETLAQVRAAVQGELGRFGRSLVTLVLTAGLILTGLNVYGAVSNRRRDFGRRRALGAKRPTIIALIALQTGVAAVAGGLLGTVATTVVLLQLVDTPPDARFSLAILTLAVLAAVLAAIPPAVLAAYRDPVRVLRVP